MRVLVIYIRILICVLSFLLVPGCVIYNTQIVDIPLINEKNDLRIDAGICLLPSAQATISYGLTDKIAIQTSGSIGLENRYYFQIAPGFYKKFRDRNVLELYAGFGHGYGNTWVNRLSNYPLRYIRRLYGDYQLYFTQLNFGRIAVSPGQMDYGIAIKAGYFHSSLTDHNYYEYTSENGPFPRNIQNSILIEPVWFFRSGKEKVKFIYKFGLTWLIKLSNSDNVIPYAKMNMGIGINFNPDLKNKSNHR